jgi:hypothetical protein
MTSTKGGLHFRADLSKDSRFSRQKRRPRVTTALVFVDAIDVLSGFASSRIMPAAFPGLTVPYESNSPMNLTESRVAARSASAGVKPTLTRSFSSSWSPKLGNEKRLGVSVPGRICTPFRSLQERGEGTFAKIGLLIPAPFWSKCESVRRSASSCANCPA